MGILFAHLTQLTFKVRKCYRRCYQNRLCLSPYGHTRAISNKLVMSLNLHQNNCPSIHFYSLHLSCQAARRSDFCRQTVSDSEGTAGGWPACSCRST